MNEPQGSVNKVILIGNLGRNPESRMSLSVSGVGNVTIAARDISLDGEE